MEHQQKTEQQNGVAYPYVAIQLLTDSQDDLQEDLRIIQ